MALASALGASIGLGVESTYGTAVAPTNHWEARSVDLDPGIEFVESEGIRSGSRVMRADRFAVGKKAPELQSEFDVLTNAFARMLVHMTGESRAAASYKSTVSTGVYLYTLQPMTGDPNSLASLTFQAGAPDRSGTVRRMDLSGAIISEWTLSNEVDGILSASITAPGRDLVPSASAITSVSYPSSTNLLYWTQGAVTVDGTAAEVKSVNVEYSHGFDLERFFIGSGLRAKPIPAEMATCQITVETEFGALPGTWASSDMVSKFRAGTVIAFDATWTGSTAIASTNYPYVQVTAPACRIAEAVPSFSGGEIIGQTLTLDVVAPTDGSEPLTVKYQSSESLS